MKSLQKQKTPRNRKYLDWISTLPCVICNNWAEPHHSNPDGQGGEGIKCSDYRAVPLCHEHHMYCHRVGKRSFWEFWGKDPEVIIKKLNQEWKERKK